MWRTGCIKTLKRSCKIFIGKARWHTGSSVCKYIFHTPNILKEASARGISFLMGKNDGTKMVVLGA